MSDARKRAEEALEEHDAAVAGDEWAFAPISLAVADALRSLLAEETAPPADAATEAVREAAKIVRDILTAFEARITSQGMLTWSQPDTPTGFVPAILWLERLALAPAPKPAICHGCTGEVEAHPYGQWPCDNHPLRRSAPAPAPSAKEPPPSAPAMRRGEQP